MSPAILDLIEYEDSWQRHRIVRARGARYIGIKMNLAGSECVAIKIPSKRRGTLVDVALIRQITCRGQTMEYGPCDDRPARAVEVDEFVQASDARWRAEREPIVTLDAIKRLFFDRS